MFILALKGGCKPYDHKKRGSLSIIQIERHSNKHVGVPPGAYSSDGFGGVTEPGTKFLAFVDNIPRSRGVGWEPFVGPRHMLGKFGKNLDV